MWVIKVFSTDRRRPIVDKTVHLHVHLQEPLPRVPRVLRDIDLEDGADIPGEDVSCWVTT